MAEYGFDVTTAKQLLIIKKGIDKKFSIFPQNTRDYIFLRVVGTAIYQDLGLSDQEAKQLNYNLRLQHALANGGKTIKEMYNEDSVKGTSSCNNAKENYKKLMEQ